MHTNRHEKSITTDYADERLHHKTPHRMTFFYYNGLRWGTQRKTFYLTTEETEKTVRRRA